MYPKLMVASLGECLAPRRWLSPPPPPNSPPPSSFRSQVLCCSRKLRPFTLHSVRPLDNLLPPSTVFLDCSVLSASARSCREPSLFSEEGYHDGNAEIWYEKFSLRLRARRQRENFWSISFFSYLWPRSVTGREKAIFKTSPPQNNGATYKNRSAIQAVFVFNSQAIIVKKRIHSNLLQKSGHPDKMKVNALKARTKQYEQTGCNGFWPIYN